MPDGSPRQMRLHLQTVESQKKDADAVQFQQDGQGLLDKASTERRGERRHLPRASVRGGHFSGTWVIGNFYRVVCTDHTRLEQTLVPGLANTTWLLGHYIVHQFKKIWT